MYKRQIHTRRNEPDKAISCFTQAEAASPDYCFPNRVEEIRILETAVELLPEAPMAHYYLGNLLYDKKQYESAIAHWAVSYTHLRRFRWAVRVETDAVNSISLVSIQTVSYTHLPPEKAGSHRPNSDGMTGLSGLAATIRSHSPY